jgi:HPt (histidine-containing phosphotransfer) domain-containing protein
VEPDANPLATLDREQLRDITMNDEELMREALNALWDDTTANVPRLEEAVKQHDSDRCVRLAHYSKGACANLGANRAAAVFRNIEMEARQSHFHECGESLCALARALEELKAEIASGA